MGPGLSLKVDKVDISTSGEAVVTFTVKDSAGNALDVNGKYTLGAINARFVLGWLGTDTAGAPTAYTAYTTTEQTSPINQQKATLPAADSGGTFTDMGNGVWQYKLKTTITVADQTKTHSVGAYATRTFEGKTYVANEVFSWVPGGGTPVDRELVTDAACNKCHSSLRLHGGSRRSVKLCTLCHLPGATDPDTGNTVDLKVMVHKIHMGHDLPSVQAGGKYEIIGFQQSVHDYSTVRFPTWHEINSCESCHTGKQADRWKTNPSRAACGSCHDLVSFVSPAPTGMTLHSGGAMTDDTGCTLCHKATGGLAPIETAHLTTDKGPTYHQVDADIVSITNTAPGQAPVMTFTMKIDGAAADILAKPMTSLSAVVAGPNTDFAGYTSYRMQGSGAVGTLAAGSTAGTFTYTFPAGAIPATATGSWSIGIEGYVQDSSTVTPNPNPRSPLLNEMMAVAVTDTTAKPRRSVIDHQSCLNCHRRLYAHGGNRTQAEYCNVCHNPNNTNDERVSRLEGTTVIAHPVHLKAMLHSIHMGEELTQPYILGGNPTPSKTNAAIGGLGTPLDFGEVRFPRPQNDCAACHKKDTWTLPIVAGALPTKTEVLTCTEDPSADTDNYCDTRTSVVSFAPPETAACTSCHDSISAKAHASLNTTSAGAEACATCHGAGKAFDIAEAHALTP